MLDYCVNAVSSGLDSLNTFRYYRRKGSRFVKLDKQLTYVDFFAGCGGLSLGLEQAGYFPLYVNELNSDALETYLMNRDEKYPHLREKFHSKDIKETVSQDGYYQDLLDNLSTFFGRDFRNERETSSGVRLAKGFLVSALGARIQSIKSNCRPITYSKTLHLQF